MSPERKPKIPNHLQFKNWMSFKLRDVAAKGRVSSLDVPDLETIADALDYRMKLDKGEAPEEEDDMPGWGGSSDEGQW